MFEVLIFLAIVLAVGWSFGGKHLLGLKGGEKRPQLSAEEERRQQVLSRYLDDEISDAQLQRELNILVHGTPAAPILPSKTPDEHHYPMTVRKYVYERLGQLEHEGKIEPGWKLTAKSEPPMFRFIVAFTLSGRNEINVVKREAHPLKTSSEKIAKELIVRVERIVINS